MLIDYHLHSDTSEDAIGSVADICRQAVEKGFDEICITNHQEWDSVLDRTYKHAMTDEGWARLMAEVNDARKAFPKLKVKVGCEIGYYPEHFSEIKAFTRRFMFDYIIGSVHNLGGIFLEKFSIADDAQRIALFRKYYSAVLDLVAEGGFDCLGHLDMISRYHEAPPFESYADLIGSIIEQMAKAGIGFELNTAGWAKLGRECHPPPRVLDMLSGARIRKVTLGSDSHSPATMGKGIEKGMVMLRNAGFKQFCTFDQRKPHYHLI